MNIYKEESVINRNNLIEWFEAGCKHDSNYKIGTEHEKFVYIDKDLSPVGYEGEKTKKYPEAKPYGSGLDLIDAYNKKQKEMLK